MNSPLLTLPHGQMVGQVNPSFAPGNFSSAAAIPAAVSSIVRGSFPAVYISNAVDPDWCGRLASAFSAHPEVRRESVDPVILSLGEHLYACGPGTTIECYFEGLDGTNRTMEEILPEQKDPLVEAVRNSCLNLDIDFEFLQHGSAIVRHGVLRCWGQSGDQVKGFGSPSYFALPHEDYEETNASHPMLHQIHGVDNVYSIILCIDAHIGREPTTILWNRRLTLDEIQDPANRHHAGSYGFSEDLLAESDVCALRLNKGDMAVIPAHNVHAVVGFKGYQRSTYMAFFHVVKSEDGKLKGIVFRT